MSLSFSACAKNTGCTFLKPLILKPLHSRQHINRLMESDVTQTLWLGVNYSRLIKH